MKWWIILLLPLMSANGCGTPIGHPVGTVPPPPKESTQKPIANFVLPAGTPVLEPSTNLDKQEARQSQQALSERTITQFRDRYQQMGNPRIALYVNQELSDEVREWTGATKFLLGQKESTQAKRKVMALGVDTNEETTRTSQDEEWVWDFENGFMTPFLSAGTQLVDRATIMRLSALKTGKPGSSFQGARKRTIEMEALLDFADIFVEVLVTKTPSTPLGYEIKAVAKEVRTGVILAHASNTQWSKDENTKEAGKPKEAIPTSTGYKMVVSTNEEDFPSVAEVSNDLALEIMNALIRNWG